MKKCVSFGEFLAWFIFHNYGYRMVVRQEKEITNKKWFFWSPKNALNFYRGEEVGRVGITRKPEQQGFNPQTYALCSGKTTIMATRCFSCAPELELVEPG